MAEARETDQIAIDYSRMGDCVSIINKIIAGDRMAEAEDVDKKIRVGKNVKHLELMVAKDDWGSEDMTASNSAIAAGKAYIG